jgi:hypothetical protein
MSRRFHNTPELNVTWLAIKKEASGRGNNRPGQGRPQGGPPQADRSHGGADRPPPPRCQLSPASGMFFHRL